jgi:hypothetical protein
MQHFLKSINDKLVGLLYLLYFINNFEMTNLDINNFDYLKIYFIRCF